MTVSATGLVAAAVFFGLSTSSAHAYLDPGTGSMFLQLLLGGVAGLAVAGKLYWYKFLSLFGVKSKTDRAEEARGAANEDVSARAK